MAEAAPSWGVILHELEETIGVVTHEHGVLEDIMSKVESEFLAVQDSWRTPAADTFNEYHTWFSSASKDLNNLLEDAIRRLRKAYENYHSAEEHNRQNLTAHDPHSGHGGGRSNGDGGSGHNGPKDPHAALDAGRRVIRPGVNPNR